jgi:hypothetical protein
VEHDHDTAYPSLFQIALQDVRIYQFFSTAVLLISLGLMIAIFTVYTPIGVISLLVGCIPAALLFWRLRLFRAILEHAEEATGQVVAMRRPLLARRGHARYRLDYTYIYQGRDYRTSYLVSMPVQHVDLSAGDTVRVLVHRNRPQHALIPSIYML